MDKTEAVNFIENLAKGYNPITGEYLENNVLLDDVKIVRKLFEIRDLMVESLKYEPKDKKTPFVLKTRDGIQLRPMAISAFVDAVNRANKEENMKKLTYTPISKWLLENKFLELDNDGKKIISVQGKEAGIYYDHRISASGKEHDVITYPIYFLDQILNLIESGEIK